VHYGAAVYKVPERKFQQNVFVVLVNCASWGLYTEKRSAEEKERGYWEAIAAKKKLALLA
jgi:hypothetical protein